MIAITGATGHLGRLVIEHLLDQGVEPADIIAAVRSPEKAADLKERGVAVRYADYSEPGALADAFEGVDRLLLISSSEVGQRAAHHRNVVEAARKAGVGFLAYTSMLRADTSPMQLAAEHKASEETIRQLGIPFALLRNGWYTENYTENLGPALEAGAILGSAGDGLISAATRSDFAAAAATVLRGDGHEGAVYELGGDDAFTMAELADEVSRQSGKMIVYRDVSAQKYEQVLADAGVPEPFPEILADSSRAIADGHLYVDTGDLRRLIGRPTTPLADAISEAVLDEVTAS